MQTLKLVSTKAAPPGGIMHLHSEGFRPPMRLIQVVYAGHSLWAADFRWMCLSEFKMQGADFFGCDFLGADFRKTYLSCISMMGSNISSEQEREAAWDGAKGTAQFGVWDGI